MRKTSAGGRKAAAPRHRASPAQIREELLHLALQPLAVAPRAHVAILAWENRYSRRVGKYLKLGAIGLGAVLWVWFSAVHHAGEVKARKAARRGEV